MARGAPDYGVYQRPAIAEQTVWTDDFELPSLRWTGGNSIPGQLPVLSTTTSFSGIQSVLLNVPFGFLAASSMIRRFPLLRVGRIGTEFLLQGFTKAPGRFLMTVTIYDGGIPSFARLIYDTNARTISIAHLVAGVLTTTIIATDVYMATTNFYFLPVKLVIDTTTDMYVSLLVAGVPYDLSTYVMPTMPASPDRTVIVYFEVTAPGADDLWMYIDDFSLSQNEP